MRKKQICRKQATALLAAVCITGGPVCTPMYVYAGERAANTENGTEIAQQIEVPDGIAGRKNTKASTVSGPAIQAPEENGAGDGETPGTDAASDGEYTDEAGVVYKYRIDGSTVDIYEVSGYDGKDVQIPSKIEGTSVAKLTMSMGFASIRSLTIPETVVSIKDSAFQSTKIGSLIYNAIDASGLESGQAEPFYGAQIASFSIGEGVRAIPAGMFGHAMFQQETVVLDVPEIREGAFASASFKGLTVGEHVASIGKRTFAYSSLEKLNYNAASASVTGTSSPSDTMFQKAEIGRLQIGPGVKGLPYGFLCDAKLSLDVLTIPDSVESIGDYAFFSSAGDGEISIGTLTIGKNAAQLGDYIFGGCSIGQCFLNLLHAPNGMTSYMDSKPQCGSVESHNIGIYFDYFTANTDKENITVLCRDFDTSYSGEYFDTDKGCFAKRKTVTCTECGHKESSVEYSDAVTVVFQDYDGTELSRQTLHPGEDAEEPADTPKREGWGFTGWDKGFTGVTEDLTVTAQYKINEYQVTFYDADGKVIHTQTVKHGGKADCPQAPEKAADANHTYIFKGWDKDTENITGDTGFYPVYDAMDVAANAYTVTFMDGETILDVQKVEAGKDARAPKEPARPDEAWGKWKFTGWEGNYKNIARDEVVHAVFEQVLNEYQVTFYDADGKVIHTQTVKHGGKAELPQPPEKAAGQGHAYVFKGWDGSTENITRDTSFHPVYEARDVAANAYTVTFMDGAAILDVQKVEAGKDARIPKEPARPDEAWGKWKFTGWEGNYKNVTRNEIVQASFEKVLNEYQVTFYDADGKILNRQTVKHGGKARMPQAPEKAADKGHTYVFKGWDGDTENITGDTSFRPVYETKALASTNTFTVIFVDGDTVLDVQEVKRGSDAKAPENPSRPDEAWGKWRFTGWEGSYQNIMKDEVIHACFEEIRKEYKVVFYDADGDILCTQTVKHGGKAEAPSGPKKEADEKYTYVFQSWDGSLEDITKDTAFRPVYESRIRKYKVVFLDGEKVLGNQKIAYGDSAIAPPDPVKRDNGKYSYTFDRWDTDFNFITEDTTVHAIFTRKEKNSTELKDGKDDGTGVKKEDKNQASKENNTDQTSGSKGNNTDKPNGSKGSSVGKAHNTNGSSINQDKAQKENNLQNTGNSTGNHAGSSKNNKSNSGNSAGNPGNGLTNFGKNVGGTGSSTVNTGKKAGDSTINTGSTGSRADSSENMKSGADTSAVSSRAGKDKDKSSTDARMNRGNKTTGNKDVKGKEKNETGYKKEPRLQPQQLPMPITIQPKELPEGQKSGEAAQKDTGKNDGEATKKTEDNRQQKKINNMEHARWLFLLPGVAAAGILCIWLNRNIFQKKKISGTICRESGESVRDIEVKLENGGIHKINTDSSGQFCFDVSGKCNCRLTASIGGRTIFSLDIHMDEKEGEDVFCIRKSHCSHIQPRKEKGRYVVDVTV